MWSARGALLCAAFAAAVARAYDWSSVSCPARTFGTKCTLPAVTVDSAVALFYQTESPNSAAGFECLDARAAVLCASNWTQAESGSVGSCFFLLPAGGSYSCAGWGDAVNVLSAAATALTPGTLVASAGPTLATCPTGTLKAGSTHSSCSQSPLGTDAWVSVAWAAGSTGPSAFSCNSSSGDIVCSGGTAATAVGGADTSSCNFFLSGTASLTCTATTGEVTFTSASSVAFAAPYAPGIATGGTSASNTSQAVTATEQLRNRGGNPVLSGTNQRKEEPEPCPPATAPPTPNDCDCLLNNHNTTADMLVTITAASVDTSFNSFWCQIEGTAVCAFGSNTGMAGASRTCSFLVPPGASYFCEMQWGALAFPASSVTTLATSIFYSPQQKQQKQDAYNYRAHMGEGSRYVHPASEAARIDALWSSWRQEYGVSDSETARDNFAQHVAAADLAVKYIQQHPHLDSAGKPTRFNAFATLRRSEWQALYRGKARPAATAGAPASLSGTNVEALAAFPPPPAPPAAIDWRAKGVVTGVKDQGQCGSCWSFSTTGAVEGAWAVAGGGLTALSEQWLVSCDPTNQGCDGGFPAVALSWLAVNGSVTEASYPYVSGGGSAPACQPAGHAQAAAVVTGYRPVVPSNSSEAGAQEDALVAWMAAYGPTSVLIDAMTQIYWVYTGGIITTCCDSDIDHAVLLVGFNNSVTAPDVPYYIIKNSWGSNWGEDGYFRLAIGSGECGIDEPGNSILPAVAGGVVPPLTPYECPWDAQPLNNGTLHGCLWVNGTSPQMVMPPSPTSYCAYASEGYLGYTFDGELDPESYPCAPSMYLSDDGGAVYFCVLQIGEQGFQGWPPTATPYCDQLQDGVFGYTWTAADSAA